MSSSASPVQIIEDDDPDVIHNDDDEMDTLQLDEAVEQPNDGDDSTDNAGNFDHWREKQSYDVEGEGGGSWDDFFRDVDNQRSESEIEEQSLSAEDKLQRMRDTYYRSMTPVSASAYRLDPNQGVATLPVKKAVCYGVCSIDEAEPLTLMKCAKCSMLMKPISYGHHMRFHHEGEIAPATPQAEDDVDVVSDNDCQDFLLSPLHVHDYGDDEPTTSQSTSPPAAQSTSKSSTQPEKGETDPLYIVEKKENLKIIVKRSPHKSTTKTSEKCSKKPGDSAKKVKFEASTSKTTRKRSVNRKGKKDNDLDDKMDTTPTFKQPKQRRVAGGPSTSAAAVPSSSKKAAVEASESSAGSGSAAGQPTTLVATEEEEARDRVFLHGARRAADVQSRVLSAQYDDATSCRNVRVVAPFPPASSAPASARSSPSSATAAAYFAIPQRRLSSSSLALQLPSSATSHDERLLPNGHINVHQAYERKKLYGGQALSASTKLVPVNASSSFATPGDEAQVSYGGVNIDMLNYADFSTAVNGNNVVDGNEESVVLPSSMHHQQQNQQQFQQSMVGRSMPHHHAMVAHHHQQHSAHHLQFAHGRLAAVKPVVRQYHHPFPTTSQQQQHQQSSENFGNDFVNNNAIGHENGGYHHNNINGKIGGRGQLDNAELRHQEQMMLRAAQVIGTNPSGIVHHLRGKAQKRLFYVGSGDRDPVDLNGSGTPSNMDRAEGMLQRPSANHLVKKFRPIMPRINSTAGNVNMVDQRHYDHYPVNYQMAPNRGRYTDVQMAASGLRPLYPNAAATVASGAPAADGVMRPIAPKMYPTHRVATFHPVAPKRLLHGTTDGLTPNFTVRYGSSKVANIDESSRAAFAQPMRYAAGHYVMNTGELNAADKPTTFTTTANGRVACRVYASGKGFATTQQTAAMPYEFEKKRYLPTATSSSSSSHPLFIHPKAVAFENSLLMQNMEPPPVLEAEGRINTNMTNDNSHFPPAGDDNLY